MQGTVGYNIVQFRGMMMIRMSNEDTAGPKTHWYWAKPEFQGISKLIKMFSYECCVTVTFFLCSKNFCR